MRETAQIDGRLLPILGEVKQAVDAAITSCASARKGGRFRMVLFGSHARGEAGIDSDVDLLVVLPDEIATLQTEDRVRDAIYDFSLKSDYIFSVMVVSESQAEDMSGFMVFAQIEREGVVI